MKYTYVELENLVNKILENLTEDEKYQKYAQNDITFEEFIFFEMLPTESVEIDFDNYKYEILKD